MMRQPGPAPEFTPDRPEPVEVTAGGCLASLGLFVLTAGAAGFAGYLVLFWLGLVRL